MKVKSLSVFLVIVLLMSFLTMAFTPMITSVAQDSPPSNVLDTILKIALGFASLAGVSSLVAVLVQVFKLFGLAKDDTAPKWAAAFNLLAFLGLVIFGVFQPQVAIEILDGYAAQVAQIALFVLGFVVQMTVSKPTYNAFKAARVPLLSYSHSKG